MPQTLYFCVLLSLIYVTYAGVTEEQMKNSAKMIRNICQPKFKLADDVIDKMSNGEFPTDKNGKCFIHCVLENTQMMKKNKVLLDSAMKQMDTLLPDSIKDDYKNALTKCKDAANGEKNPCEVAYKLAVCNHANNPSFSFV